MVSVLGLALLDVVNSRVERSTTKRPGAIDGLGLAGVVLASLATGCTCGGVGTLAARRTLTPSAEVVEVYAVGLQLRPTGFDGGATAGWRRAIYFYSRSTNETADARAIGPHSSWSWFRVSLPSSSPAVRGNTTVGMELQATEEIQRLAVGYQDQLLTVGPRPDQSQTFDFFYVRTNTALTRLQVQTMTP